MELLLALAAVIVAAASLFLANIFNRRFIDYGRRLEEAEQIVGGLSDAQKRNAGQVAEAERRAIDQSTRRLRRAQQELTDRFREESEVLAEEGRNARRQTADLAQRVSQLREVVTTGFRDHGTQLDALAQQAADLRAGGDLTASLARLEARLDQQAAKLGEAQSDLASANEDTASTVSGIVQQLLTLAREVELLGLDHAELRAQLRRWLSYTARLAAADLPSLIMPGGVAAEGPAASEILPGLFEALLGAVGIDAVFREQFGSAGTLYYLAWPPSNGQSPEQYVADLLAWVPGDGVPLAGLPEFRSLLLAMHAGGPGVVRLGPLIVNNTADGELQGIVLNAEEAAKLDTDGVSSSPHGWARTLDTAGGDWVTDLTDWAAPY
jgi:hypothetical protein